MGCLKNKKGFSLIEIMTAMFIIVVVIMSVSSLLVLSLNMIGQSGEKSRNILAAAGKVDMGIANKAPSQNSEMPVKFPSQPAVTVVGGVAAEGGISAFIYSDASASIDPAALNEGHSTPYIINILGIRTHFASLRTAVRITDKNGMLVTGIPAYANVTSKTDATVSLPVHLHTTGSPYKLELSTSLDNNSAYKEIFSAELTVGLPVYVIAGQSGVYSIPDDLSGRPGEYTSLNNSISGITWGNNGYVAVGAGGLIYLLRDGSQWTSYNTGIGNMNLNGVRYLNNTFYAVGDQGVILKSQDGKTWSRMANTNTNNLYDIAFGGNILTAVGSKGIILNCTNGQDWTVSSQSGNNRPNLKCVIYDGTKFIAAGNNSAVYYTNSRGSWVQGTANVNGRPVSGLAFNGNQTCVAVCSSSYIYSFNTSNPIAWTQMANPISSSYCDVYWKGGQFVAADSSGSIYISANGSNWTRINQQTNGISNITGIAGR